MAFGIEGFDVDYEDECSQRIRRIVVRFGDDHGLEVTTQDGGACLRLQNASVSIALGASKAGCDFERAVNILRLHMPGCRDD